MENSILLQILLLCATFIITVISVLTGVKNGVRILSELNIKIAIIFAILIFLLGPTLSILQVFVSSLGSYFQNLLGMSFWVNSNNPAWQSSWTIFYWSWWISWSPFVGIFIARISKGRKIREFVLAVVLLPSLLSFLWITILGSTAVDQIIADGSSNLIGADASVSLFYMIQNLTPLISISSIFSTALSVCAILLIFLFFITSADSASIVINRLSTKKLINNSQQTILKVFWVMILFIVAFYLMFGTTTGEKITSSIQTAVILSALPFSLILILCCYSTIKYLKDIKVNK